MQNFEYQVLDLINSSQRQLLARSMVLGGVAGASGGVGGPPGGFTGYLPQKRVAYDTDEIASSGTPASGMTLYDNLNHIRYRLQTLETATSSGGHIIQDGSTTFTQRTYLRFLGDITVIDNAGLDSTDVTVSATMTGYMQKSVYDSDSDGVVDNSEQLNGHPDTYFQTSLGFTPENVANKTNDVTLSGDSSILYPTEHAVKAYVDAAAISGIIVSGIDGHVIKDSLTDYTQRAGLKFLGSGVTVSDDSVGDNTVVTITGGGTTLVYNVMDYGAVGNGVADDTTAVQDAMDAAHAAGGGVVWLPKGTYLCSNLTGYREISIWGEGKATSVIKGSASGNLLLYSYPGSLDPASRFKGTLYNFTLDGNNTSTYGLAIDTGWDLFVSHISVLNCTSAGINMAAVLIATFNKVSLEYNDIGIKNTAVRGIESNLVQINNSRICHNRWGVYWASGDLVSFDGTEIENNGTGSNPSRGGLYYKSHAVQGLHVTNGWFEANAGVAHVYIDAPDSYGYSSLEFCYFRNDGGNSYAVYITSAGSANIVVCRECRCNYNATTASYFANGSGAEIKLENSDNGTTGTSSGGTITVVSLHDAVTVSNTASIALTLVSQALTAAFSPTADVSMANHKLTNVTDPASNQDAATKHYVDSVVVPSGSHIVMLTGVTNPPVPVQNAEGDDWIYAT